MRVELKEELVEEHAGFISKKGTRNQIMNWKLIIEKYREYNKALYICFIEYRKARPLRQLNRIGGGRRCRSQVRFPRGGEHYMLSISIYQNSGFHRLSDAIWGSGCLPP